MKNLKGMRMQKANQIVQAMRKLGENRLPLTRVYRNLFSEDLFLAAYGKIYRNDGALTPGTTDDTVDGMTLERIRNIIDELRHERFHFRPSRRTYIPKSNGKTRPLGIPNFSEKLVQEAMRIVLEAYYEPRFRASSHGFRPGRGCHTALAHITHRFKGSSWFIEGDIKGCFDNIDHDVLMSILARDIQDGRMLELICRSLKAGVVEDWQFRPTYSGTPQGGILSPLLTNIYLHELDTFVEEELMPKYNQGKKRAINPAYDLLCRKARLAYRWGDFKATQVFDQQRRKLPSQDTHDPNYRRLKYCRYADDFILGFIGPKSEAKAIREEIGVFMREVLHLELHPEKTLTTHARTDQAHFLGYGISTQVADDKFVPRKGTRVKTRAVNGKIRLAIPYGVIEEHVKQYQRNGKPIHRAELLEFSDAHIILTYQLRYRGLAEYYKFAANRRNLAKLKYTMEVSLVKTLAHKFKISVSKVYKRYTSRFTVDGSSYKTLHVEVPTEKGTRHIYWGAVSLKVVKVSDRYPINDTPSTDMTIHNTDLVQRLQAQTCELCGRNGDCEVHHVRKLADLKQRWAGRQNKPEWVKRMTRIRRKTLVVCRECHQVIHHPN